MVASHSIVLYVEDDEADRFFMERAFNTAGLPSALHMVNDGRAAVQYLSGTGPFADRSLYPVPQLVLLDLKIPELSGFEVLEWIRKRPEYVTLPVIVFSSSSHPDDPVKAKALGANDYWKKPANALNYAQVVNSLRERWL
jgi:CheY-like chemotaxis protein